MWWSYENNTIYNRNNEKSANGSAWLSINGTQYF